MAAILFPSATSQFFDNNGEVLSLGTVEILYSTNGKPAATYKDSIKSAQNEFPINLTAAGKAEIYLASGTYIVITKDQTGQVVDTIDIYQVESAGSSAGEAGNIPIGGIIMYSGLESNIPEGFNLCNSQNGTVDLRNRFVLGASTYSEIGTTGGQSDATVTQHSHPMPHTHPATHHHTGVTTSSYATQVNTVGGTGLSVGTIFAKIKDWSNTIFSGDAVSGTSNQNGVGISIYGDNEISINNNNLVTDQPSVENTGSTGGTGVGTNLPPFLVLAYIQRIS